MITLHTNFGDIVIELDFDKAPKSAANFEQYAKDGFYNDTIFHRVIDGFMAQTGDPTGTGTGGSGLHLEAEFSKESHLRGTCSMARSQHSDSADSQFFICLADASWLDGQYSIWGQVRDGMEFVDNIKMGAAGSGAVNDPDAMISVKVLDDDGDGN